MENKATSRRTWNEAPGPARFHSDSDSESVSETGSPRVPLSAERRQPDIARSHRIDDDLSDHYIASPRDPSDAAAEASALQGSQTRSGRRRRHSHRPDSHRATNKPERSPTLFRIERSGTEPATARESLTQKIKELEQEIIRLSEERARSEKSNKKLRKVTSDLARQNERLQHQLGRSGAEPEMPRDTLFLTIETLEQELNELSEGYTRSEKYNKRLRREISELAMENEKLQHRLADQDSEVRAVQDHQLQRLETKGFLHAEDDGVIREKLRALTRRWKSYAKEYAFRSPEHIRKTSGMSVAKTFQHFQMPEELLSSKYAGVAPVIVLNATLARFVTFWIFQKPFFCLANGSTIKGAPTANILEVAQAFESEYRRALSNNGDPSLAHIWRSLTLQLFDPADHEAHSRGDLRRESAWRKERYYQHLRESFDDYHRVLYRPSDSAKREEDLLEIMRSAGELFSALWKQKVYIEPRLDHYQQRPFRITSEEMEAHPSQHLDEGDPRMDGHPVQLVVQPAVLAFGNEEGKRYDEFKVWAKAVVWLGSGSGRLSQTGR